MLQLYRTISANHRWPNRERYALCTMVKTGNVSTSRKWLHVALAAICLAAVSFRLWSGTFRGPQPGWPAIQATYLDLAANIADGHGYRVDLSPDQFLDENGRPPEWSRLVRAPQFETVPSEYYLPGYPLLIAPAVKVLGPSYGAAQVVNALFDGVLGTVLAFLLLGQFGHRRAGLLAAGIYASASPLLWQAALVLPDAFSPLLSLAPCVFAARALRSQKPAAWLIASGLAIGVGVWFRGELVALVPVLALLAALCLRAAARPLSALVIVGWLIGAALLAGFWLHEYQYVTVSRPGLGVRLWEGLGRLPNPWGIAERDDAFAAFLAEHGQRFGTGSGDALAVRVAFEHIREAPEFFKATSVDRFGDVISTGFLTNVPYDVPFADQLPLEIKVAAALALMVAVLWGLIRAFRLDPALGVLILGLWAARALPFTLMHEERRDLVPLLVPYLLCVATLAARRKRGHPTFQNSATV